jgi:hypothetical protein
MELLLLLLPVCSGDKFEELCPKTPNGKTKAKNSLETSAFSYLLQTDVALGQRKKKGIERGFYGNFLLQQKLVFAK